MKKKRGYFTALAVASGVLLSLGGATAASASEVPTAASAVHAQTNDRIAVEDVQPHLGGYCTFKHGEGHVSWSVPGVYPPGTKVVAESKDPGREWTGSFAMSDGGGMLPTYKSKHSTTYRLKFVTPTGTESKESTITYHRPLMGQCDTTFVVNGTGAQNIDYPEGNAIRSISNAGPGVTHVVMNDSAFQSSTYRFVVRVDNNYLGEAHAGTAHYIANRDNGDGTRTLIIPTKPGERTVDVVIDNTAPGWGLSAASQVVASMTIG